MNDEIQKVLSITKAGKVTEAQAAQLIAALVSSPAPAPAPARSPPRKTQRFWDRWGVSTSATQGVFASDLRENDLSMSSVDIVHGEQQVFRDNTLSMSSIGGLALVNARVTGNTLGMTSFEKVALDASDLEESRFQSTSVDDWAVERSTLRALEVHASSWHKFAASDVSELSELRIRASQLKGLGLRAARWRSSEVVASQVAHLVLERSTWEEVEIDGCQINGWKMLGSTCTRALLRKARFKNVTWDACAFDDVLFSGGESLRRGGFEATSFERCTLRKAIFSECRFVRTVIRDVDLFEVRAHGVELVDQTIEGNEAFLRAVGESRR